MIKSIAAANRADLELRRLNTKASAYYRGTDGFTIYEENGEYIMEYCESNNDREFKSFDELEKSLTEMYEDYTAEVIADEFKELYQGWNDDLSARMNQAAERYHKAEKVVELYNELYANDWTEDTILKDHENGYLTINEGRDGNEYAWYGDELKSKAVNLATGEVIDSEKIDEILV